MTQHVDPNDFIITRKRKKYRFALFANSPLCFELKEWDGQQEIDTLEVGAGTGLLSVALASNFPDKKVVAVDVKADRLQLGATKAAQEGLKNVRFLRARVDQLGDAITEHSVSSLWVTFPDPFPKKRAAKNRLTYARFLGLYAQLLRPDGMLYFKTDARDLFTWSLEQLVQAGWHIAELSFDLHESSLASEYKITTTYETKYLEEGRSIYFVSAVPPERTH